MLLSENKPPKYKVTVSISDEDIAVIQVCRHLSNIILKGNEITPVGSLSDKELLEELGIPGNYYIGNRDILLSLAHLIRFESKFSSFKEKLISPMLETIVGYLGANLDMTYYFQFEEEVDDAFATSCKIMETEDVSRIYLIQHGYKAADGYDISNLPDWYVSTLVAMAAIATYVANSSLTVNQPDVIIPYSNRWGKNSMGNH